MTPINQLLTQLLSPTVFPTVLTIGLLLFSAVYGGIAAWRWIVAGDLISKGEKCEGRIFSKQKEEHRELRRNTFTGQWRTYYIYYVTYVYDYDGVPYEHTQRVNGRHYERFEKGQIVAMACMRSDPNTAQLIGADADSIRIIRPAATALLGLILMLFVWLGDHFHWFKK
jgi:hypothetical protein